MLILNYYPVPKKDYCKIEQKNRIFINVFSYEYNLVYPVYVSDKKFEDCIDLLLIADENKLHYVYMKDFYIFLCNKIKNKNKKHFCRYYLQCFSSEQVLEEHKKVCLKINGEQSVKLKSSLIKFKNYFNQLAVHLRFLLILYLF